MLNKIVLFATLSFQIETPKPTPVLLGRDMTPSKKHVKPLVVPKVVKVTLPTAPTPAKAASVQQVNLQTAPVYDGSR